MHTECVDGRIPKSRTEYWTAKLSINVRRDTLIMTNLRLQGWESLVIWECESSDTPLISQRLVKFLGRSGDRSKVESKLDTGE